MEEFKRGDIIVDTCNPNNDTHYLILKERENSFYCLDTIDFEPVAISKDWINQYAIVDSIDINKLIGFLKENQNMAKIQVIIPEEDENITYIVSNDFANYICQEIEEKINKEHRIDFIRKLGELND